MAKSNSKTGLFVLLLSLLLIVATVESKPVLSIGKLKAKSSTAISCVTVVGVNSGDTCFDIAKNFDLSTAQFDAINPNLNCAALFVGQWVCVSGSS